MNSALPPAPPDPAGCIPSFGNDYLVIRHHADGSTAAAAAFIPDRNAMGLLRLAGFTGADLFLAAWLQLENAWDRAVEGPAPDDWPDRDAILAAAKVVSRLDDILRREGR